MNIMVAVFYLVTAIPNTWLECVAGLNETNTEIESIMYGTKYDLLKVHPSVSSRVYSKLIINPKTIIRVIQKWNSILDTQLNLEVYM